MKRAVLFFILSALLVSCSAHVSNVSSSTPQPTATLTPSATFLPSVTPTPKPTVQQTNVEIVTADAATGDGGNAWGGHQTRIVHTQDGIFTAYTVAGGGYLNREWHLAERQNDGTWNVIAQGESGREPVNLLASPMEH